MKSSRCLATAAALPVLMFEPAQLPVQLKVQGSAMYWAALDGQIYTRALDADGVPSPLAHAPTLGSTPRNFCLIDGGGVVGATPSLSPPAFFPIPYVPPASRQPIRPISRIGPISPISPIQPAPNPPSFATYLHK